MRGMALPLAADMFRSALPREERRDFEGTAIRIKRFDPRSRARSDDPAFVVRSFETCFDPRSRARSDSRCRDRSQAPSGFDPRSRARSDLQRLLVHRVMVLFRSALPREERLG